jgi:hypothetical protein
MKRQFQIKPDYIYYFSDGSVAQYKSRKSFFSLCFCENDNGVTAKWLSYAISHGKDPCYGVAGTVKRLAARANLQQPYNLQIITPLQLHIWRMNNIKMCDFEHITSLQYKQEEQLLQK